MSKKEKYIDHEILKEIYEDFDELRKLLEERISELYQVKGGQAERHTFIFYRNELRNIHYKLKDNIKP